MEYNAPLIYKIEIKDGKKRTTKLNYFHGSANSQIYNTTDVNITGTKMVKMSFKIFDN